MSPSSAVEPKRTIESAVFICGCGHSGTTLMANMLAAHPDVYIPLRETEIFREEREAARVGYAELVAEAEASDKRVLAEKTPKHIRRIGLIRELVPGARFLIVVRDGRDVAASYGRRIGDPGHGVRQWIKSNSVSASQEEKDDVLVYRHEDLIEDPTGTLTKICEFMSIPFDEGMLRYHEKERNWFGLDGVGTPGESVRSNAKHRNWQVNQPIFDNRGKWKSELTTNDFRELLKGRGLRLMKRFGYLE
ncbi:MAG: hypothetical protein QOH21_283 [Acidobacteriota bacterium]|nr:hypothetical protein [Acidobacteriota bacterium]